MQTKVCGDCKKELPFESFYVRKRKGNDLAWSCKDCVKTAARHSELRKRLEDPVGFERGKASRALKSTYGITLEQYEEMFALQNGKCGICKEEQQDGIRLCVDHDHSCCPGRKSCGKCIRGLLCTRCNTTLGKMNDSPEMLRDAADYIELWRDN